MQCASSWGKGPGAIIQVCVSYSVLLTLLYAQQGPECYCLMVMGVGTSKAYCIIKWFILTFIHSFLLQKCIYYLEFARKNATQCGWFNNFRPSSHVISRLHKLDLKKWFQHYNPSKTWFHVNGFIIEISELGNAFEVMFMTPIPLTNYKALLKWRKMSHWKGKLCSLH